MCINEIFCYREELYRQQDNAGADAVMEKLLAEEENMQAKSSNTKKKKSKKGKQKKKTPIAKKVDKVQFNFKQNTRS